MDITEVAIKRGRVTLVFVVFALIAGAAYFATSPKAEDPGFSIRTAQVVTTFTGASPKRVEELVTDPLETAIQEMPELKDVTSSSKTGISIISVNIKDEYRGDAALRPIWDSLRRKVDAAAGKLPDGVGTPTVNDEFGDVFGTVLALTGEGYSYAELKDIADDVRDELLKLSQVAKIDIFGAQDERIYVEFDTERLSEIGLSPPQLRDQLAAQNIVASGGTVAADGFRYAIEPTGNFESVEDIEDTLVRLPGSNLSVRLADVTRITRGFVDPPSSTFRSNGTPGLALAISMKDGGNILVLGEEVNHAVERLQATYPWGVTFDLVNSQAADVDRTIQDFTASLLQAVLVVLLSVLVFLGLRTGLVVASLIPMAVGATMVVMSLLGMGLDKISLAALIIALGLLVDNGVVMSEATLVRLERGESPGAAALASAQELRVPLLISSLTTIAAFLPLALAENVMGEFLGPLALVLAITLLASWLTAVTAIPLLCAKFLRVKKSKTTGNPYNTRFYGAYRRSLLVLLRHPLLSALGVVAAFVGGMWLFRFVPALFMPDSNHPTFTVELKGPRGMDIDTTNELAKEIEAWMSDELLVNDDRPEGLRRFVTYTGTGGPRFHLGHSPEDPSPEYSLVIASATSFEQAQQLVPRIQRYVAEHYPNFTPIAKLRGSGGGAAYPIGFELWHPDDGELWKNINSLRKKLRDTPGVINVRDNWGTQTKKVVFEVDDARAKRAGVTHNDVATALRAFSEGFQVTEFREGKKIVPTLLRSEARPGQNGRPAALNVFSQASGKSVPLQQVASWDVEFEPPIIRRKDRRRIIELQANLVGGVTADEVNKQVLPWLEEQAETWGVGAGFNVTGEAKSSAEAMGAVNEKLPIGGFLIVMLLVLQFNSLRRSTIVLVTIPLGVIGVVLGLLIAQSYFGFMTFLGVLSLAGILINNGIVLLDKINVEIEGGASHAEAVVEAAQSRLRPILLTTATTMLGLLPLWFGSDPMWPPMAIAIIFGLLFGTLLTLGVVPVLFTLLFRVSFRGFEYQPKPA